MSLINEALKKAQRLRHEGPADPGLAPAAGTHVTSRTKGHGANTMVLIGSGALVLVVLSVVFTVYLVNRPAKTQPIVPAPAPVANKTPSSATTTPLALPPVVTPTITPPATTPVAAEPPARETTLVSGSPASKSGAAPQTLPVVLPPIVPPPAPVSSEAATAPVAAAVPTTAPAAPAPVPALAPDAPDERVTAFVESVRVTGIRSSGTESRVLMNERVYRVNDIVERNLNVRLVKATADSLTFSDPRGVVYVKRF